MRTTFTILALAAGLMGSAALRAQQPEAPAPATPPTATKPAAAPVAPPSSPRQIAQAYLYLEPFQARVEVLFDSPTVLGWLNMPTTPGTLVNAQMQATVVAQMTAMAQNWCKLRADESAMNGQLTGVAFVKGEPGRTLPMEAGAAVPATELMVGLMFEFTIPGSPAQLELQWSSFKAPVERLPLTIFFANSSESMELSPTLQVARWENKGRLPKPKPLAEVPTIPRPYVYEIPLPMIVWVLLGLVIYIYMEVKDKKFPGGFAPFLASWLIGIGVTYNMTISITDPFATKAAEVKTTEEGSRIVQPLLRNVYRAFDYRTESDIYDRLDRSVHGELLRTLYLQTVQALTLDGSEGARVHVTDLSVDIDKVSPAPDGFIAEGEWTALGTVGHWGHQHQRVNRYKAKLTVQPIESEWKITGLEVLEERRL
ncbi:MAG: hypothetical protein JNM99_20185 [Verrucomicrobiaceae bacterium]|nr:hypothetical protein [Verrucomicrobiaceae bacterium]